MTATAPTRATHLFKPPLSFSYMLQSLDTLIAFVVILLSTSLLVTILVQMLSSAFALRGKNLGNALALTFQSIHPGIGADAYALAERVLSDPRLSDSATTRKKGRRAFNSQSEVPVELVEPVQRLAPRQRHPPQRNLRPAQENQRRRPLTNRLASAWPLPSSSDLRLNHPPRYGTHRGRARYLCQTTHRENWRSANRCRRRRQRPLRPPRPRRRTRHSH